MLANCRFASMRVALLGEKILLNHKGVGSDGSQVWISICLTVSLKSTPHLLVNAGVHGLFVVNGSIMGISLLILFLILPETKNERHTTGNTIDVDKQAKYIGTISKENSNNI